MQFCILLPNNYQAEFEGKIESTFFFYIQIYPNELESQSEFNGFREWLLPFDLYRGKKTGEESEDESRVVGTFKVGNI